MTVMRVTNRGPGLLSAGTMVSTVPSSLTVLVNGKGRSAPWRFLTESTGHHYIMLTRRGNRLYGVHRSAPDYTYPGPMALEVTRAE